MTDRQNIVIIGAGFGGLRTAVLLAKKIKNRKLTGRYNVILIDRNKHQTYTPLLYEAATVSKDSANYSEIKKLVVYSIDNEVVKIDLINGDIHCQSFAVTQEELKFDYLVLASGSEVNYFNIPGLAENSLTLKTFIDALKIRDKVLDLTAEKKDVRILIGGGGSSGVELAGELKKWLPKLSVTIVEAAPTILSGLDVQVINKVEKRLKDLGVEIITNEKITQVQKNKVLTERKELLFDALIWCGGVKPSRLVSELPLKTEAKGRIEVGGEMLCLPQSENLELFPKQR